VIRHIKVALAIPGSPQSPQVTDPLVERVREAVRNPWHIVPSPVKQTGIRKRITGGGIPRAFLEVSRPGLYRITREQLEPFGFAYTVPRNLHLLRGEEEVAFEWLGDDDASFEAGEAILFYAEPRFSRWSAVDAYHLTAGDTPGLRISSRSADPAGLPPGIPWTEERRESNTIYMPDCFCGPLPAGRDGDRWAWADLRRPGATWFSTNLSLPSVHPSQPASLTLWLIGYTSVAANPDHRVNVAINGTLVGQVAWDGKTAVTSTLPIPAGLLTHTNVLTLTLPGIPGVSVEGAWLDAFAVRYAPGSQPVERLFFTVPLVNTSLSRPSFPDQLYLPLVARNASGAGTGLAYTVTMASQGPYLAYEVTDPLRPVRLIGFRVEGHSVTIGAAPGPASRYFITSANDIRVPDRIRAHNELGGFYTAGGAPPGADYLLITHPAFSEAAAMLASLRREQGLSTFIANVLGIYDTYGDGRPDPEAIRAFIAEAYATWTPRPLYVLLLGDGSFDPRQYRPSTPPTFIPPYLAPVDPWAGETAADNRYACVDGNDNLPDLLIGRIPVHSAAEALETVRKIVDYETGTLPGGWNAYVLLVADDPDAAGDFPAASDAVATYVTAPFTATRHYCFGASPSISDCPSSEAAALHAALIEHWKRGALLIQFTGHSSWHQWAVERLFHLDDMTDLANGRRLPVVLGMSCFTGAFHRPESVLDEALVTLSGGGALATWGQTGLGVGTGHAYLADGFFRAFFYEGVHTVGEAAMTGKIALAARGLYPELLDTFTLLGDPASRPNRRIVPWAQRVFLPLVTRW
ncbi:MAG: C25 family cysteine peptidase, partial [Anaerolineae bacterium]|nr:C25 family cysteine peptidase [Anaerolineae bacterium]